MISQTAEYALRALVCLGEAKGKAMTTEEIAGQAHTPFGYLVKIMAKLSRSDLVHAQRGRHGGFTLSRDPKLISIMDVLTLFETASRPQACPRHDPHNQKPCPLYQHIHIGYDRCQSYWRGISLAKLCRPRRVSRSQRLEKEAITEA